MGDLEPGAAAVEPPPIRAIGHRARRSRRLTGLSGILLFACIFLPAIQGCNQPVAPLDVPALCPPYLYGLVFAWLAMARTPRGVALGVIALRLLAVTVIAGSVALLVVAPPVGALELIVGLVLLLIVGMKETTAPRVAATGLTVGLVSMTWFGMWSMTSDALIGVHLSLASSIGLFIGCLAWLRALAHHEPVRLPRATARR